MCNIKLSAPYQLSVFTSFKAWRPGAGRLVNHKKQRNLASLPTTAIGEKHANNARQPRIRRLAYTAGERAATTVSQRSRAHRNFARFH